jgi:hypothetical protein
MDPRDHRQLIVDVLRDSDLDVDEVGQGRWMTMLSGEWKRTIPLLLELEERSLRVSSLLSGALDEGHREVYRLLLHRNERLTWVHFALDDAGDIVVVGTVPRAALTEAVLDEVLGQVLLTCDETFNSVLRAGFAGYIDAEQRWREKNGLAPNPVSTQG